MIHQAISDVFARKDLTEQEMEQVMEQIGQGLASALQIGALIVALGMKGETPGEIAGVARVLRKMKVPVPIRPDGPPLIDTAGTGGDHSGTFNISTTAAFVLAACGLRVAKHGNRSFTSRCGSADVMEALGVSVNMTPEQAACCIDEIGIGFLFAPQYHPAMAHAVHPRKELGLKSIFNLAGPLTNPADAPIQLLGVFRPSLTETMAKALSRLGSRSAIVVHGMEGLDEISLAGPTRISHLHLGELATYNVTPDDFGLPYAPLEAMKGGDSGLNAGILRDILHGRKGPRRDIVLANVAAGLLAAGLVRNLPDGVAMAEDAIDRGAAMEPAGSSGRFQP